MLDLVLHIDLYDKSICRTVSIGHVPESKEQFYKNNLYRAFKGFVIPRRIYPSWDSFYPMLVREPEIPFKMTSRVLLLEWHDLVSPKIRIKDPLSVSPR